MAGFCKSCGTQVADDAKFCINCGVGAADRPDAATAQATASVQPIPAVNPPQGGDAFIKIAIFSAIYFINVVINMILDKYHSLDISLGYSLVPFGIGFMFSALGKEQKTKYAIAFVLSIACSFAMGGR